MTVDYLAHSGFLAETDSALLLFDYYKGDIDSLLKRKTQGKPLFVFASHFHSDHFNPAVFSLSYGGKIKYILSSDIKRKIRNPVPADILFVRHGGTYEIGGLGTVRTLLSTDEGVAFLVNTGGTAIFHAGDLNWWDWPGEDKAWLNWQKKTFCDELGKIAGTPVDIAFAVLDDRLGENAGRGLEVLIEMLRPRYAFPMHFWKNRGVVSEFISRHSFESTVILNTAEENRWELD